MTLRAATRYHEEFARVLRRADYSDEFIHEVLSQLPDPIDFQRDGQTLARHGLHPEPLMGGSPDLPTGSRRQAQSERQTYRVRSGRRRRRDRPLGPIDEL